jgi:hypothetical protein
MFEGTLLWYDSSWMQQEVVEDKLVEAEEVYVSVRLSSRPG